MSMLGARRAGGRGAASTRPSTGLQPEREGCYGLISWFSDSEDAGQVGRESLRLGSYGYFRLKVNCISFLKPKSSHCLHFPEAEVQRLVFI